MRPGPRGLLLLALLAALASLFALPSPAPAQEGPRLEIREISIRGNRMVEESTVRSRIESREGDVFDPERITLDVRAIYELGFFEDIRVEAEGFEGGLRIIFHLREKPIVRSISFEGNDEVSESDIREKFDFAARSVYNPGAVTQARRQLEEIYREKGFYLVSVEAKTEPVTEGEVNLIFVIDEGRKFHVGEVRFTGNETFPDSQLRKAMATKARGLFSFLTGSGKLVEETLQDDRQRVLSFYQDHGYLEARVGDPEVVVDREKRRLEIVVPVTEGEQYRLGTIELSGDDLVPLEQIKETMSSLEGEVFRRSVFTKDLFNINQLYTEQGYAYVKVDYASRLDSERQIIDVTLLVNKGEQTRIGRIVISGNIATRDKVIRRNITFQEGDLFNSAELRKSRRKVMNLGFFESVDIVPRPREDTVIDIDIELKEKLTGAFTLGIGYSSEDRLAGQIRLSESNLFGRGQSLQLMIEYGETRQNYNVGFSEPSIFDSRYSFGFKVFDVAKEYDEYDDHRRGMRFTLGRSVGEYFRGYVTYKWENVDISNVDEDASNIIKDQEGESSTSSLELTLIRDSRDNYFNPSRGNRTALTAEYAGGILGGDNYFTKFTAESAQYIPLWWKLILMLRGNVGVVDGFDGRDVPIYERFFLGGIYSVRGFEPRSIGPKDENGDPTGGYKEMVVNAEIIVPLDETQGLNLVLFADAGNAWDFGEAVDVTDLRTGAGLGIRWLSPMGPFRLEWGWNLSPRDDEPKGDWGFAIGTFF